MSLWRQVLLTLLGAVALAAIASGLLTMAWVGENLSGDFADQETGKIYVGRTVATFLIWSAVFATPLTIFGTVAVFARQVARRVRGGG